MFSTIAATLLRNIDQFPKNIAATVFPCLFLLSQQKKAPRAQLPRAPRPTIRFDCFRQQDHRPAHPPAWQRHSNRVPQASPRARGPVPGQTSVRATLQAQVRVPAQAQAPARVQAQAQTRARARARAQVPAKHPERCNPKEQTSSQTATQKSGRHPCPRRPTRLHNAQPNSQRHDA